MTITDERLTELQSTAEGVRDVSPRFGASTVLELIAALREARASIAWVGELNPSVNYESDGAIIHITFDEFDAMRAVMGLRPAHRGKEKAMTVSRRWVRQMRSERDAAIARAEQAEREKSAALGLIDGHGQIIRTIEAKLSAALADAARLQDKYDSLRGWIIRCATDEKPGVTAKEWLNAILFRPDVQEFARVATGELPT